MEHHFIIRCSRRAGCTVDTSTTAIAATAKTSPLSRAELFFTASPARRRFGVAPETNNADLSFQGHDSESVVSHRYSSRNPGSAVLLFAGASYLSRCSIRSNRDDSRERPAPNASPTHLGNAVIPSLSRLCKVGRVWCRASSLISTNPAVNRAVRGISDIGTSYFHALARRVSSVPFLVVDDPDVSPASLSRGFFARCGLLSEIPFNLIRDRLVVGCTQTATPERVASRSNIRSDVSPLILLSGYAGLRPSYFQSRAGWCLCLILFY